jgi:hypothetical protein
VAVIFPTLRIGSLRRARRVGLCACEYPAGIGIEGVPVVTEVEVRRSFVQLRAQRAGSLEFASCGAIRLVELTLRSEPSAAINSPSANYAEAVTPRRGTGEQIGFFSAARALCHQLAGIPEDRITV